MLAAAATQLEFTTAEQILTAGTPSQTMIVDLADAFGNPVDAGSNLALSLTTTSYAGQFIDGNGNVLPYPAPLTIVAGASAVSFQYADTTAGAPTITVTAAGVAPATQLETVVAAAASQLDFTTSEQVLTAGVPSQTMTVELDDAFGNPVSASTPLTVSLSTTSVAGTIAPLSPLTIPAGDSTVSFYYTDTAAGAPTITATAANFAAAAQQETVLAAAASQLAFITAAQTLTAATPSQTMTVQLEDAFGNPVDASTPLTVSLSTTSVAGTFAPPSPLTIRADGDTASFRYADTLAGTPTVTAAAAGLASARQVETVDPAAASRLTFTTAPQTLTAGASSGTITLTLEDASGNVADATGAVTVNLNTTSVTGTFTPSSLTVPAGTSSVSFHYKDATAGTPTITATASGIGTATQQETVVPAAASQLVFTTPPQTLTAGTSSGTITIVLEDAFGNPVTAGSALTVSLSTTSAKGTFGPASPLTIAAGTSTVSFQYTDAAAGTPTITATVAGVGTATQQETISPAAASQLVFTTAPQSLTAGTASGTITVALEDALGNPVAANSALTIRLTTTSGKGTFAPASPLTIAAGADTVSFDYSDTVAGTPTIAATASGLASATQQETVNPAAASQLAFTTAPQTLTAGVASGTITVALEDAFGNPLNAGSALTVSLTTTSGHGAFVPASPLTIPAGAGTASFQYKDTSTGAPTLTAAAGALAAATQQETVNPAAASQLAFTTAPQTLTAGLASGTITLAMEDAFDNPVTAGRALTVSLSTTSGTGQFLPVSPLTIPAGAGSVSFQFSDSTAGTPTLTATAGNLTAATQKETVNPAAADQLTFVTAPQTLTAGVSSGTITLTLEDSLGNPVAAASALTVSLSTTFEQGHLHACIAADDSGGRQYDHLPLHGCVRGNADAYGHHRWNGGHHAVVVHAAGNRGPGGSKPTRLHHATAGTHCRHRVGHDYRCPERRLRQSGRRRQCRDGQPEHDFCHGPVRAGIAPDDSGGRQHRQLPILRHHGGNADRLGCRRRFRIGHAAGNRQRGRSQPLGIHHRAADNYRGNRFGHDNGRVGGRLWQSRCDRQRGHRRNDGHGHSEHDFRYGSVRALVAADNSPWQQHREFPLYRHVRRNAGAHGNGWQPHFGNTARNHRSGRGQPFGLHHRATIAHRGNYVEHNYRRRGRRLRKPDRSEQRPDGQLGHHLKHGNVRGLASGCPVAASHSGRRQ